MIAPCRSIDGAGRHRTLGPDEPSRIATGLARKIICEACALEQAERQAT
jgi:hypothetical protein